MPLVKKFCFWFSVRFGSAVIGIFTLIQTTIWFMICLISCFNLEDLKNNLQYLMDNLSLRGKIFKNLTDDPRTYLILMIIYFSLMIVSSIFLLYGVFKCKRAFLSPFIILDFLYIVFLLSNHIVLMLILKQQEISLASLIFYSNIGGFLCMYLFYMWISVISFHQILKELDIQAEHMFFQNRTDRILAPVRANYVKY